jgi:hypothetical protein
MAPGRGLSRVPIYPVTRRVSSRVLLKIFGELEDGNLTGSGLTVEISPRSIPNCRVARRGLTPQWNCPMMTR